MSSTQTTHMLIFIGSARLHYLVNCFNPGRIQSSRNEFFNPFKVPAMVSFLYSPVKDPNCLTEEAPRAVTCCYLNTWLHCYLRGSDRFHLLFKTSPLKLLPGAHYLKVSISF